MNFSVAAVLFTLTVTCSGSGTTLLTSSPHIVSGLTSIGSHGLGLGHGVGLTYGGYGAGLGYGHSGLGSLSHTLVAAAPAVVASPAVVATPSVVATPTLVGTSGLNHASGLGYGLGWKNGVDGYVGYSGHGVTVKGPNTVPAVISGPSGKIVADGLYGVPNHGHGW